MKYLSTFSGIEAATVAWHPLGWEPVGFSEIEPFPSAVLSHHYKQIKNYGDITKFEEWAIEPFQLLVGGSPCQSFSVAGLRKGLADPRGNLMLTYLAVAEKHKPQWIVWENVPGVLSSNGGRDFGTFLGALGEIGYGYAYRVLDAQFFGVAQRRRRVFVIGYLGDWRPAAAVLFESESLSGNPPPSREKRKGIASFAAAGIGTYSEGVGTIRSSGGDLGGGSETLITKNHNIPVEGETTGALLARDYKGLGNQDLEKGRQMVLTMNGEDIAPCLIKSMEASVGNTQDSAIIAVNSKKWPQDISPTLNANFGNKLGLENQHIDGGAGMFVPAHAFKVRGGCDGGGKGYLGQDECTFTLSTNQDQHIAQPIAIDWRTTQVDVEKTGTLKTDLAKMSGPCIVTQQPFTYDMSQVTSPQNKQNRVSGDPCHTLAKDNANNAVILQPIPIDSMNHLGRGENHSMGDFVEGAPSYTITKGHHHAVAQPITIASKQQSQNIGDDIANPICANDYKEPQVVAQPIPYNVTFCDSNGTRKDRPNGGLYVNETEQSGTITREGVNTVIAQPIAFQSVDDGSDASEEISGTLRSHDPMAVAQPISIQGNLVGREKGGPHGVGVNEDGTMYTLTKGDVHAVAQPIVLDDQGGSVMSVNQDGIVGTLRKETHGHEPIVAQPMAFDWQSGGDSRGLDPKDTAQLQRCQVPAVMQPKAYAFDSLSSNSMKSANPVSGCNQVEISKTLDTTDPNPSKNQGGMAVVQPVGFHATRRDGGRLVEDVMPTVEANWGTGGGNVPTVTQPTYCLAGQHPNKNIDHELSGTLPAAMGMGGGHTPLINDNIQYAVRRLTPIECERLQGFPDNYTAIPWKKKDASECPDGPRYKALGNSMAVPVMQWIGERIQYVENLMKELNK